ncbi:XRE family transcriptional regulator [Ligilactobacillus animalis]|uniref:XRE family transcriptional regulator n=1 Tax=Ligilactobacillus animalis TaxID=1605 RepID=UPI003AEFB781
MTNLTYKERITVQLMRNKRAGLKPTTQADIAKHFGLSRMYVSTVINEVQSGKKSDEWRVKFAEYAGMEV